jgi:hypothetical protein
MKNAVNSLDSLFPRAGGAIWKGPVIQGYTFKIFKHVAYSARNLRIATTTYYHVRIAPSSYVVKSYSHKIIHDLICHDFFYHHSSQTHLNLELHLRRIICVTEAVVCSWYPRRSGNVIFSVL